MSSTIWCLWRIFCSTSSPVAYWPVLVFFCPASIFITSNNTSPSCFGEPILNFTPACLYTFSSACSISTPNTFEYSLRKGTSNPTPSYSISISTGTSGFSTCSNTRLTSFSSSSGSNAFFSCRVMSASSAAYSFTASIGASRILVCPLPFFPISVSILTGA